MLQKLFRRKTIKSILFMHLFHRHNAIIDRYVTHVNLDVARQGASSTPVTLSTNRMIFFFFTASSRSKIHSSKTCPVIQAFLFASYGTRKFLRCLKHRGFLLLPMISGETLSSPVWLAQRSHLFNFLHWLAVLSTASAQTTVTTLSQHLLPCFPVSSSCYGFHSSCTPPPMLPYLWWSWKLAAEKSQTAEPIQFASSFLLDGHSELQSFWHSWGPPFSPWSTRAMSRSVGYSLNLLPRVNLLPLPPEKGRPRLHICSLYLHLNFHKARGWDWGEGWWGFSKDAQ